jgi:hypothetical protein
MRDDLLRSIAATRGGRDLGEAGINVGKAMVTLPSRAIAEDCRTSPAPVMLEERSTDAEVPDLPNNLVMTPDSNDDLRRPSRR